MSEGVTRFHHRGLERAGAQFDRGSLSSRGDLAACAFLRIELCEPAAC
jgi:hypothetical protein